MGGGGGLYHVEVAAENGGGDAGLDETLLGPPVVLPGTHIGQNIGSQHKSAFDDHVSAWRMR